MNQEIDLHIGFQGRDEVHLTGRMINNRLKDFQLRAVGCEPFLEEIRKLRDQLVEKKLAEVELPSGNDHSVMLVRELLMKLNGVWQFPYEHEELCHCRVVTTETVDAAVLNGAESAEVIARMTSAGTGCGTCRKDSEKIIAYRRD